MARTRADEPSNAYSFAATASSRGAAMSHASYWTHVTSSRMRRRSLLKGAAGLGVGAAALSMLGCGGSDSGGGGGTTDKVQDKSGLLSVPQDTSAKATPGGILPSYFTA